MREPGFVRSALSPNNRATYTVIHCCGTCSDRQYTNGTGNNEPIAYAIHGVLTRAGGFSFANPTSSRVRCLDWGYGGFLCSVCVSVCPPEHNNARACRCITSLLFVQLEVAQQSCATQPHCIRPELKRSANGIFVTPFGGGRSPNEVVNFGVINCAPAPPAATS